MNKGDKVTVKVACDTGNLFGVLEATKTVTIDEQGEANAIPTPITPTSSDAGDLNLQNTIARIKANLRSLATALEAYFVDNNIYPTNPGNLTTPIAYITQIPLDPFSKDSETLKLKVTDQGRDWVAWSVGPDQKDEQAMIEYDPTNGTVSGGDILRRKM